MNQRKILIVLLEILKKVLMINSPKWIKQYINVSMKKKTYETHNTNEKR